mmetsp:Transcript_13560/g.23242  ORF Transcript_13560/g.23242 Transcript_13560/m.23242 type:complete len:108 (+) Transcript_13560:32-355(+)
MPECKAVTIFGSSSPSEGDTLWKLAEEVGEALASRGYHVKNGGYSGTMEASAKGASRVKGYTAEGVVVPSLFPYRKQGANSFLTTVTEASDLIDRLRKLTENARSVL